MAARLFAFNWRETLADKLSAIARSVSSSDIFSENVVSDEMDLARL
jgi:hypothetical protein